MRSDAPDLSFNAEERGCGRARQKRRRKSWRLGNEQQTEVGRFDKRWKRGDEEGELPLNMLIPSTQGNEFLAPPRFAGLLCIYIQP